MAVCIVGKVLEPEAQEFKVKGEPKIKLTFGILSGRTSTIFSVWEGDRCFEAADRLNDGDLVIATVGYGVKEGKLTTYLNRIAPCSDDLPMLLNSFFVKAEPAAKEAPSKKA